MPVQAALDAAVPAQEQAKSTLRREFAVFRAQRGTRSLASRPVLLCGNHPGRVPSLLVQALAEQAGLPWLEVSAARGVCIGQIVSKLAQLTPQCRENHPLGIALLNDLQYVPLAAAEALAGCLTASDHAPHVHRGQILHLSARQVFWVGSMRVPEASRATARTGPMDGSASFALFAVGPSAADVVAAGVAGARPVSTPEADQSACLTALADAFKAPAWLLPGTREDLVAWARAESAPWWPGARLRAFCDHHGVAFVMGEGAAEALAAEAECCGGTVDAMEDRLRDAMDPVLAVIADPEHAIATVEMTPAAVALIEAPRLGTGARQPPRELPGDTPAIEGTSAPGFDRPARTPHSPSDIRLARLEDLSSLLSPTAHPTAHPPTP